VGMGCGLGCLVLKINRNNGKRQLKKSWVMYTPVIGVMQYLQHRICIRLIWINVKRGRMVKVKVERLDKSLPLPSRQKGAASGFDLYASTVNGEKLDVYLQGGNTLYIGSGISIEIPIGYEAIVRPRSSLSKLGIICAYGTIDEDYRGEIGVVLTNTSSIGRYVRHGDRIAQLVIQKKAEVELVEVDEVDTDTVRGEDGFGSSGKGLVESNSQQAFESKIKKFKKLAEEKSPYSDGEIDLYNKVRKPPPKGPTWPRDGKWYYTGHRGEYNCPHGVGHGNHVHGCDNCCKRDDYPLKKARMKVLEDTIG